jgi:hypothetical protein
MDQIPFLVAAPPGTEYKDSRPETKGLFRRAPQSEDVALAAIPVDALRKNLSGVSQAVLQVLADIRKVGDFRLKEVELQVEVTAEGGVQFIGTAKLGGKGASTLTFAE